MNEGENRRVIYLIILAAYSIFSVILCIKALVMHWDFWPIIILFIALVVSWVLHITEKVSRTLRLWIVFLMSMLGFFYYGIHTSTFFDMAPTIIVLILVFSITEKKYFVYLTMITFYLTMAYDAVLLLMGKVYLDASVISRVAFHLIVVFMSGYLSCFIINRREKQRASTDKQIVELKEINTRTEDFLANVSHELRTPINAVTGMTSVMLKTEKDEGKRQNLISVNAAGNRLFEQIEDILDYTEIDAGRITVAHEKYIITSLVNDIINEKRVREGKEDVEIIFDTDVQIPSILIGDSTKIKKIIVHLVENALKYTKKGGVYVRIYTIPKAYGVNLCINVEDTGIGMTSEELERVQDGFYQSNASRSRRAGGLGLGLSVACGMVNALGGFIQFKSKKDEGTTIIVSIPQEVLDESPIMKLDNPQKLCLAAYLIPDKYLLPRVREYYNRLISNVVRGLDIELHRVYGLDELKRLENYYHLTHLFIADEEYLQDKEYFESLHSRMRVVIISKNALDYKQSSKLSVIKKPLSTLPLISVLNSDFTLPSDGLEEKHMKCLNTSVLVVDDEPMNLLVAQGIFKNYGIKVTTANGGKKAIDICENEDFDLIFLDHMMPEMDGVETLHHLRRLHMTDKEQLKVIAFTANAMSSARDMFLKEGFDDFISKPIELTELERLLKRMLPENQIAYEAMEDEDSGDDRSTEDGDNSLVSTTNDIQSLTGSSKESESLTSSVKENESLTSTAKESIFINQKTALEYCGGDQAFYKQLVENYLEEESEKREKLTTFCQKQDMKNYQIFVHGLKSASRMIGADDLSDHAKSLEDAAKGEDKDLIAKEHPILMDEYALVCQTMRGLFDIPENKENDNEILPEQASCDANRKEKLEDLLPEIGKEDFEAKLICLNRGLSTYDFESVAEILPGLENKSYGGQNLSDLVKSIRKDLDDFEADRAKELVDQAMEDFGIQKEEQA